MNDASKIKTPGVFTQKIADGILNRFFQQLENLVIPEMDGESVRVSIGIVFGGNDQTTSFQELYQKSDQCAYDSKKKFGNYVTYYEEEHSSEV